MSGWVEKQKRRAIRRALGGPMVGVIEEHGSMIEKMGSGVQNDILTLRAEMMEQGRRLIAELVEQERRLRLLETLADMAWYRRWWWVLSGRGL